MYLQISITFACTLSLILADGSASSVLNSTNCIIVDSKAEENEEFCNQGNTSCFTCVDLSYVLSEMIFDNTEIILQGDHYITQTLTISDVNWLTIRGNDSTIHCTPPTSSRDTIGPGLVFTSVSNLTVSNVTFEGCGTLQYSTTLRENVNVKYCSAVYIINSTNIHFIQSSFIRSMGRGLSLHDVNGHVEIKSTLFSENMVPEEEQRIYFGGGGLYIEFTYCTPGYPNCNRSDNMRNINSTYIIKNCRFEGNIATNSEGNVQAHIVQFRLLAGNDGNNAGQGGGIAITFKGTALQNSISIINCTFLNNSAQYGGGIEAIFQDFASENRVNISNCTLTKNRAAERGGGALQLGYIATQNVSHNSITITDTDFVENSAAWGGGVAFYSTRSKRDVKNTLKFMNCRWVRNSAAMGAGMFLAISAWDSIFDGTVPTPVLHRCSFIDNQITNTAALLRTTDKAISQHVLEAGILNIDSFEVEFSEAVSFIGSKGSAIVATSSQINVLENTLVTFRNNSATNGGAMALFGFSVLELFENSHIIFDSNNASELGGAVYATSPHQVHFIFSHKCFISYYSIITDPDNWNASLNFTNNFAGGYGHAIYTDSLLLCAKYIGEAKTNVSNALQWKSFMYNQEQDQYIIATSPVTINFTLPEEITPGERINIHPLPIDDLDQMIPTALQVFLDYRNGIVQTSSYISDDGYLQITGEPGTEFKLTVQTQNTRHVSSYKSARLADCPLGFTVQDNACICSASTIDQRLVGISECNTSSFNAFLQIGYWIGCDGNKVFTSYCQGYCKYHSVIRDQKIIVPKYCKDLNLCNSYRKGQVCGECEDGYTAFYHSDNFKCGRCSYGAAGLLLYSIAELVPLALLFAIIMVLKLKMTSGLMQSLLLFAQTITFIDRTPSFILLSKSSQTFLRIHAFLMGFFSLDFFRLDELSFCLWSGATVLDNLVFHYLTTFFAVLFLCIFVLLVQHTTIETKLVRKIIRCEKVKNWVEKNKIFKNAIVHGISSLLILSYTQYTVTSFQILSRKPIYGDGEKTTGFVVHLQGNVKYFGGGHLPYAIPALLVLLFLSLPPPLLLISYPLLWKIKAKVKCTKTAQTENDTTLWPIRKLLPLIDSFQGVFRDNCRMFAGLLFLWRVILSAFFALCPDTRCFIGIEVALICFFLIHAVARPYKRRLFNIIDVAMLANMCIITALSWYIVEASLAGSAKQRIERVISIKIILMYLPILTLGITMILWILKKCNIIQMNYLSSEDDEPSEISTIRRKDSKGTNDEDLFARAAELNNPPLAASTSEIEVTLRTNEMTTCDFEDTQILKHQ